MKRNMGNIDKGIRVVIAAAIGMMYYLDIIQGILAYILMAAAIILLVTSLINFCPLYKIFGLNTKKSINEDNT